MSLNAGAPTLDDLTAALRALLASITKAAGRGSSADCSQFLAAIDDAIAAVDEHVSLSDIAAGRIDLTENVAPLLPRVRALEALLTSVTIPGDAPLRLLSRELLDLAIVKVRRVVSVASRNSSTFSRACAYQIEEAALEGLSASAGGALGTRGVEYAARAGRP